MSINFLKHGKVSRISAIEMSDIIDDNGLNQNGVQFYLFTFSNFERAFNILK